MKFRTMSEVRVKNAFEGSYFFCRTTMKYWGSKIESRLYRGTYFITSERNNVPNQPRKFTIRRVLPNGLIETEGAFQAYKSLRLAKQNVKKLIESK